jgi:hypothetical protein
MAPLPTITDTYRVSLSWRHAATGQIAVNVIHVRKTATTATAIAALVDAAFQIDQWATVSSGASIIDIAVTPLDGSSVTVHRTPTGHVTGETAGDMEPAVSCVTSFYSAKRGRSYRGRFYAPFFAESDGANGSTSASGALAVSVAWAAFATALGAGAKHVVASYKHSTAEDIITYVTVPALGTQRRRQTRVRYP